MILTLIVYRNRIRFSDNFKIGFTIPSLQIYINNYAQNILHFVWNIFQQTFCIIHTNHVTFVIQTYVKYTSLRIGKTKNPFQILITPRFLIFNILCFHIKHVI